MWDYSVNININAEDHKKSSRQLLLALRNHVQDFIDSARTNKRSCKVSMFIGGMPKLCVQCMLSSSYI